MMCYSCAVASSGLKCNASDVFLIIDINAIFDNLTSDSYVKVSFIVCVVSKRLMFAYMSTG